MKFFKHLSGALLLFLGLIGIAKAQDNPYPERVWADEFDQGNQPGQKDWNYETGAGGWGNNEAQYYTDESQNVRIENGKLIIEARKDNNLITSARITTQNKHSFQYGRIEARAKLPSGKGTWPAFWMLGDNISQYSWPACGEIDIMEYVGYDPGKIHGSLHTPSSHGNTTNTASLDVPDAENAYHVYAIEWDEDKIRFFVDDINFYTYQPSVKNSDTWPFDQKAFIILNLAIGGNWGGAQGIDESIFPQRYEIDYVRVYQSFSGDVSITAPGYVEPLAQNIELTTNHLEGATYEWILPEGVSLVEGQGTSKVKVNWGESSGEVKAIITYGGQVYEVLHQVQVKVNPAQTYALPLGIENWQVPEEFQQNYSLSEETSGVTIDFEVNDPADNPYVLLNLPNPLNMESFHKMTVRLKSEHPPHTMRIDLLDVDGIATASSEVFKLHPLNSDGQWHEYVHYFEPNFASAFLDETSVKQLRFYINYGLLASAASGNIYIDQILVDQPEEDPSVAAPTELAANTVDNTVELQWKQASDNEKGFRLYRQSEGQESAQLIAELPVDAMSYSDHNAVANRVYTYQLQAYNQYGESEAQNVTVSTDAFILGIAQPAMEEFGYYPNPVDDWLIVEPHAPAQVSIFSGQGKLLMSEKVSQKRMLSVSHLPAGVYLLAIASEKQRKVFRMLKR